MTERAKRGLPHRGSRIIQTIDHQGGRLQISGSGEDVQCQFSDGGAVVGDQLPC